MKIVNAVWEKRNLGVECVEISFDSHDSIELVENAIMDNDNVEYAVVKVTSDRNDILYLLNQKKYQFIEVMFKIENRMDGITRADRYAEVLKHVGWEEMSQADIDILYDELDKNLFEKDRISVDPLFSREQAAKRYKGWVSDLIEQGKKLYNVYYNGDRIGFFVCDINEQGIEYGYLAGCYDKYIGTGLGLCVYYAELSMAKKNGAKKSVSSVSGNNMPSLKTAELLGYYIVRMEYVFVKHNGREKGNND